MRTTLDLPEPLLRSLKIQAAQNGTTLKFLLHELIVRAVQMPAAAAAVLISNDDSPPVLARLVNDAVPSAAASQGLSNSAVNETLADNQLLVDLEKLRRSGFIA